MKRVTLFEVLTKMYACPEDKEKYRGVSLTKAWNAMTDNEDDLYWLLSALESFLTNRMNRMIVNAYNYGDIKNTKAFYIDRDDCYDEVKCTKAMLATVSLRTVQRAMASYVKKHMS